jgi:hypothetical protein
MWIVTGVALAAMAWFDPLGPLLVLFGAGWCAVVLDHGDEFAAQPARLTTPLITEQSAHSKAS